MANLIDESPVLAVLGSQAAGGLTISGAQELRVKESDRISAIVANLRAMGIEVEETADGLSMAGAQQLRGADIVTRNDHRIAMSAAVLGLKTGGMKILNPGCVSKSYPGFFSDFSELVR